ncbi:MAG: formate dehydrogenase accessory sulfurtransferase FdhD [Dehalococcoidia bacterium]|nr:formate dehydrogenase accessory sulfurtransferase FdhD [Dehalococcoidia bacterium]MCA9830911.1 formate dehydrogenase accessory sulfurtransferase FdhD [Dehalococcoidia bacterium]MCB9485110.1 formate dehydrogenase accessory sulfurtransferase FdhD [Thermoflexaceae bacterium]
MQGNRLRESARVVTRYRAGHASVVEDHVAAEEPMETRILWEQDGPLHRKSIAVTMRTPGDDFALAAGFLFSEGLLATRNDIADISYCRDEHEQQAHNIVSVTLRPGLAFDAARLNRNFYTTSSCGVCGKASLDALSIGGHQPLVSRQQLEAAVLSALPRTLRAAQPVFESTGGLHGAGLFDNDGNLIALKEDVGRHNAVDKLIGEQFLAGSTPLDNRVLMLSGRASFELVQKALAAGIPVVAAVGAPSSLAIDIAEAFGITLAGFVRPESFNVYTGRERILT